MRFKPLEDANLWIAAKVSVSAMIPGAYLALLFVDICSACTVFSYKTKMGSRNYSFRFSLSMNKGIIRACRRIM